MDEYLIHHGIRGQKWGVRRYQNYDGTLTTAGKLKTAARATGRYGKSLNTTYAKTKLPGSIARGRRASRSLRKATLAVMNPFASKGKKAVRLINAAFWNIKTVRKDIIPTSSEVIGATSQYTREMRSVVPHKPSKHERNMYREYKKEFG